MVHFNNAQPVCGTTVAVVNPETREICLSHEIGEIWVSSKSNIQPYETGSPFASRASQPSDTSRNSASSLFHAKLKVETTTAATSVMNGDGSNGGDTTTYVRTGEVGFLWNYSHPDFNQGQATGLLFVLGPIGETFEVNGLLHFPQDVEETVEKSHPSVAPNGWYVRKALQKKRIPLQASHSHIIRICPHYRSSIVFQAEQATVCVVQTRDVVLGNDGVPCATVNLNMVLSVMHRIVERHQFVPDVIAVVAEGVLAKDRDGAKQRGKMLSLFMSTKM
jgi:acyl-CoA synthetase (AMP-forming)/AMP-acid ligase II